MKNLISVFCFLLLGTTIYSQTIDIASGGSGTPQPGQSYNETRGADVTVLETFTASKITLHHFNTGGVDNGFVGLRIYETSTNALVFSEDKIIAPGNDVSIPFNIDFEFEQGKQLRISFYAHGSNNVSGSFTGYKPTFPYTEDKNLMKVNKGYSVGADSFPNNVNIYIPYFTIDYKIDNQKCCCNCKLIYALLVLIVLLLLWLIRCCKKMMGRK